MLEQLQDGLEVTSDVKRIPLSAARKASLFRAMSHVAGSMSTCHAPDAKRNSTTISTSHLRLLGVDIMTSGATGSCETCWVHVGQTVLGLDHTLKP